MRAFLRWFGSSQVGLIMTGVAPIALGFLLAWFADLTMEARRGARNAQAELARAKAETMDLRRQVATLLAKPTTPAGQLAHFMANCNESMVWIDFKSAKPSCTDRPEGDGFGSGPMIVCAFHTKEEPKEPPGFLICDKDGCSWNIRNGVGP